MFEPDKITLEVGELIESAFAKHPGQLNLGTIPASIEDAESVWSWGLRECLTHFGPYEDAMSKESSNLFHTRLSPLLNLHRLLPKRILEDVLEAELPLPSKEGFIRQLIGWREFVYHVHEYTDGFRKNVPWKPAQRKLPGDGGYAAWRGEDWRPKKSAEPASGDATPNALQVTNPYPPLFWGEASGLCCLDHVVEEVLRDGYGHHITRLMVLSN